MLVIKLTSMGITSYKVYSLCCFDFFRNELSDEMTVKATTKSVVKLSGGYKEKAQGRNIICLWIRSRSNRLRTMQRIAECRIWMCRNGTDNNV